MTVLRQIRRWPWLTLQMIVANVVVILALATAWYFVFKHQSSVYSERLMSTFNIEPGSLHAMYVDDVERQLWFSVMLGLVFAIAASVGLALLIARPLRSLARGTERLQQGDYGVRADIETGEVGHLARSFNALASALEQEEAGAPSSWLISVTNFEHPSCPCVVTQKVWRTGYSLPTKVTSNSCLEN